MFTFRSPQDSGLHEAKFYLGLLQAGAAASPADVAATDDLLLPPLKTLVSALGPDSMIVRLALGQASCGMDGTPLLYRSNLNRALYTSLATTGGAGARQPRAWPDPLPAGSHLLCT